MSEFNLIEEPWIKVIDLEGEVKELSIYEIFRQAPSLRSISGDMRTQDFAVMRVLLAILVTAYSRYTLDGDEREYPDPDSDWMDELKDFEDQLYEDWLQIWEAKEFSQILFDYLDKWYDRFYLLDEQYPFFQVTEEETVTDKTTQKTRKPNFFGKNINRLISESGNKMALFSPKDKVMNNKEVLTSSEVARWLITLQGYSGTSDKVFFRGKKYKSSKGWLFDIGGLYVEGNNLFETLWLNTILVHPKKEYRFNKQKPTWEMSPADNIKKYLNNYNPDNLAELYTLWARAVYINPEIDLKEAFKCQIVKLPAIDHGDQFLEPMTIWHFNKDGENGGKYTPKKHQENKALWRSFGLVTLPDNDPNDDKQRQPGIISWLDEFPDIFDRYRLTLHSVSMKDDGNSTSWLPVGEICDQLNVEALILIDIDKSSDWVPRINDVVKKTKYIVEGVFKGFVKDIAEIRGLKGENYESKQIEGLYYFIDSPFRHWLSSLEMDEEKETKINKWYSKLYELVILQADRIVKDAGSRDYTGILDKDKNIKNIATAHNQFLKDLKPKLKI